MRGGVSHKLGASLEGGDVPGWCINFALLRKGSLICLLVLVLCRCLHELCAGFNSLFVQLSICVVSSFKSIHVYSFSENNIAFLG